MAVRSKARPFFVSTRESIVSFTYEDEKALA